MKKFKREEVKKTTTNKQRKCFISYEKRNKKFWKVMKRQKTKKTNGK